MNNYKKLSSMSLPAKTPIVPIIHTAINTQSKMWSRTIATNFHSSQAYREKEGVGVGGGERLCETEKDL